MSFGRESGLWVKMFPSLFSSSSGITEARNSQLWIVPLKKKILKCCVGIFFFCVPPLDGASSIEEKEIRSMKMSPMRKWTETSVLSLLHYLVYVCVYSVYIRSWLLPKKLIYSHTHKTGQIGVGSFPTEKTYASLSQWMKKQNCVFTFRGGIREGQCGENNWSERLRRVKLLLIIRWPWWTVQKNG